MPVLVASPAGWLDLEVTKAHLNLPSGSTSDDAELQLFIAAAELAIYRRVGHVAVLTDPIEEFHDGDRSAVRLDEHPIAEVVSVTVHGTAVAAADLDTGTDGWYLTKASSRVGLIRHTSRFPSGHVKVTYKPGRAEVPADATLAGMELVRHLWKTQRGNSPRRPDLASNPEGRQAVVQYYAGFSLPNRVLELLQPLIGVPVA